MTSKIPSPAGPRGGWQLYAEDNQEATDLHYVAYRVAEDHSILLPAMVCFDGFILSHTYEPVETLSQNSGRLPAGFKPFQKLDTADPISFGMFASPDYSWSSGTRWIGPWSVQRRRLPGQGKEFGKQFRQGLLALVEDTG